MRTKTTLKKSLAQNHILYKKFIVKYDDAKKCDADRRDMIKELYRMNITAHTLQPDLNGFCKTLEVRFHPLAEKPNATDKR